MENKSRTELLNILGYCINTIKSINDVYNYMSREKQKIYNRSMATYYTLRKKIFIAIAVIVVLIYSFASQRNADDYVCILAIVSVIVILIIRKYYDKKSIKKSNLEYNNVIFPNNKNKIISLQNDEIYLEYQRLIPNKYFSLEKLEILYSYVSQYRADTLKEAINIFEDESHKLRLEEQQNVLISQQEQILSKQSEILNQQSKTASSLNYMSDFITRNIRR